MLYNIKNKEEKHFKHFFLYPYPKAVAPFLWKRHYNLGDLKKPPRSKRYIPNERKKRYLLGDQVSALSDKIEKLSNILCKFGPLIGLPLYKMTRKGQICTTVALSEGQFCKECRNTSWFCQITQKLGLLVGNFWCSFGWCAPFGPRRLFEVTEVVMSFS